MPLNPKPGLVQPPATPFTISSQALLDLLQAVLATGATFRFQARGGSMTPFIKDGDTVTVAPLTLCKPGMGKVAAFIQLESGRLVVHRIIGRRGDRYLIQGDNTAGQPDGWVVEQALLGIITRVERGGRRIYLGQGPERYMIAYLSRSGWLARLGWRWHRLKQRFLPK